MPNAKRCLAGIAYSSFTARPVFFCVPYTELGLSGWVSAARRNRVEALLATADQVDLDLDPKSDFM